MFRVNFYLAILGFAYDDDENLSSCAMYLNMRLDTKSPPTITVLHRAFLRQSVGDFLISLAIYKHTRTSIAFESKRLRQNTCSEFLLS